GVLEERVSGRRAARGGRKRNGRRCPGRGRSGRRYVGAYSRYVQGDASGARGLMGARRILVTGAAGFVGRRVVELLAGTGGRFEAILAADIREVPQAERRPGVAYRVLDVRDAAAVDALMRSEE